jgi:DNA-binding ferritin-like protein
MYNILDDLIGLVAGLTAMGCFTGIMITWLKSRRKTDVASSQLVARLDEIAERIGRLETSVDTVAVEVERVSEAQRFTARVLAERSVSGALPESARKIGSTTPH